MKQIATGNRIGALLLALLMLSSLLLVACQGDSASTQTATGEQNESKQEEQSTTEDLSSQYTAEKKDLKGHEFVFYTKQRSAAHLNHVEVYAAAQNGEKVNDAVFKRNAQLQTDYNCKISEIREASITTVLREPLMTGEYICDFIFASAKDMRNLAKNSLMVDMTQLENIDLTKTWIDQEAIEGLNMLGKVFFVTGDACTVDDRWVNALFFNTEFVKGWDENANLYQDVRDGKWTLERMQQVMVGTAADVDGDGQVATYNKDRFGYTCGYSADIYHPLGCGVTVSTYSSAGEIVIPATPSRELLDAWEACRTVLTSPVRMNCEGLSGGNVFRSGLATFYSCNIGSLLNWGDVQYQLGILPYPKMNAEQEKYYAPISFDLGGYGIPVTVDNDPAKDYEKAGFASGREMCAYFLEAFSYYSVDTLTPAFFEQVLGKQIVMDTDSIEMLEIALSNRVYDPVIGYNFGGMEYIFRGVGSIDGQPGTDVNYSKINSEYLSRVTKAREAVQDYLTFIEQGSAA